jgi:hypothetical protein
VQGTRTEVAAWFVLLVICLQGCGHRDRQEAAPTQEAAPARGADASSPIPPPAARSEAPSQAVSVDAGGVDAAEAEPSPSRSLPELLASLREAKLAPAASVIEKRVAQESPKYDLTEEEAKKTAGYFLADMPRMPKTRRLLGHLPRTTVELVRAVHERQVPSEEAEAIAGYLTRLVVVMRFGNLQGLDVSHSHVIGREWHQIDYSDEPMTWQSQQAAWAPLGVKSFKRLEYIQTYFKQVSRMKFFKRVYRPEGKMPS